MKTRLLLSSLLIALSATSFAQTHKAHWSYNGKESPEHWGDLLTEYQTCKLGKVQGFLFHYKTNALYAFGQMMMRLMR